VAYETVLLEKQEGVGIITLNRPETLNALSRTLMMELDQVLTQAVSQSLRVSPPQESFKDFLERKGR